MQYISIALSAVRDYYVVATWVPLYHGVLTILPDPLGMGSQK